MAYPPSFLPPSPAPPPGDYPPSGAQPVDGRAPGYGLAHGPGPRSYPGPQPAAPAAVPQRPAGIGVAVSMTATASALWICALATAWLFAVAGQRSLALGNEVDSQIELILNHFTARMADGLVWPLFGLPAAAFVAAFLLLTRTEWSRVVFTALGVLSVLWAGWWLQSALWWWMAPAAYIVLATGLVWTPAATRWIHYSPRPVRS
jgi:hypothetical protein